MENASKALIIAGAILLSILIIGLGMFVYQQASNAMKKINLNEQQVQTINSKFTNYGTDGSRINGTQARSLCETVKSYNRATAEDYTQYVNVISDANADEVSTELNNEQNVTTVNSSIDTVKGTLGAGKMYELHFGYDPDSSLIVRINLKPVK